ncbi:MAG: hypothetical protein GY781_01155 [Gammaproteobacteria bacterium]|nr:hypothetical protein [Gammaproteobacteria bacterium]
MKALKSTSRGQGRLGDQPSEGQVFAPYKTCISCIHAILGVISRGRELRLHSEERSEGSVTGDASEL